MPEGELLSVILLGLGLAAFLFVAISPLHDAPTLQDVDELLAQRPPRKIPPSLQRPNPIILALIGFISAVFVIFLAFPLIIEALSDVSHSSSIWRVVVIAILLVLIGIGVPFTYARIVRSHMEILRNGLLARGKVVGSKIEVGKGPEGESRDYYYLAIEFLSNKNERREWISVGKSFQKGHPVGTEIKVLHVPNKKKIILPEYELVLAFD